MTLRDALNDENAGGGPTASAPEAVRSLPRPLSPLPPFPRHAAGYQLQVSAGGGRGEVVMACRRAAPPPTDKPLF